ncbi:protein winged eye [Anopheles ziemanni]|uniref:protein winged eye n=1 Tax=Anopheles coustani TaxID=139045 RepID=UPI00265B48BB|nr:protein winged eye [Anopheles coustani]XP_058169129.1 protein winged eye [Anopheles ziemanni]
MLGSTANGRLMGPGVGSSTSSSSSSSSISAAAAAASAAAAAAALHYQQQQQLGPHQFPGLPPPSHQQHHPAHHHQSLQQQHSALHPYHHHRNIWPTLTASSGRSAFDLPTNGEVTESLFATGGYNTPPASSPFLPCSPLELVAKNFHSSGAGLSFSQANSSIFVQSQTDFINGTTAVAKKTETCIGRWEHGTIEPLQIQVPSNALVPATAAASVGSFALNSPESVSSGGQVPIPSYKKHHRYAKGPKVNKNGADENGNRDAYRFPGYDSYNTPEDGYDDRLYDEAYAKRDVQNRSLQRLADDVKASSSSNKSSSPLERRGAEEEPGARPRPASPTTPSSPSAYGRLKRKLHSLLLETTRLEEQTTSSPHVISHQSLLHQTSHAPRQPTPPGHFPRQLEAATAPEFRTAEEPSRHHRTGEKYGTSPATSTTVAARDNATAPSSEAVNHRPRRRWAALHSALVKAKAEAGGEAAPPESSSQRPKSPDVRAAPPAEQRLPTKKRRLLKFDRTDEPPSATSRDTDTKAVVHIKREPCQVSEVTTSNSFEATTNATTALNAIIKLEASSPKSAGSSTGSSSGHFVASSSARTSILTTGGGILSSVAVGGSGAGGGSNPGTGGSHPVPPPPPPPLSAATMDHHLGLASAANNSATTSHQHPSVGATSAASIPVGIAVARQRLQESSAGAASPQLHQTKELNRFGIGLAAAAAAVAAANGGSINGTSSTPADLGCATPGLGSQNMFFTGTNSGTMIPLSSDAVTMGVTNAAVQNAVRTPPALWQYPAPLPMESMLPMPPLPPVGFQLVRDPSGQILFLPAATTIANPPNLLDKIYISCIEPFQQALVWPSYPQSAAAMQPPHLLLPQLPQQQLQPPPLAPLQVLNSDYLSSTTLHQQHTQTHHSTRYLALTSSDSSGKRSSVSGGKQSQSTTGSSSSTTSGSCGQPTIPMPIPASHAFIKIEDCSTNATSTLGASNSPSHLTSSLFGTLSELDKTTSGSTTNAGGPGHHPHLALSTTADLTSQLLFQPGNLIHITPHHPGKSHPSGHPLLDSSSANGVLGSTVANPTPPPSALPPPMTPALIGLGQLAHPSNPTPQQQHSSSELPAATCLTPPPDTTTNNVHSQVEAHDGAEGDTADGEVLEPPEVQDANIQTDTPVMSEDESTQPPCGTDSEGTVPDALPMSTETTLTAAFHALASEQPLCHSTLMNSSGDSAIEPDMSASSAALNATSASNCDQVDMELESTGKSPVSNQPQGPVQVEPENLSLPMVSPIGNCGPVAMQRRLPKLELHSPTQPSAPSTNGVESTSTVPTAATVRNDKEQQSAPQLPATSNGGPSQQEHPVDLSGLELLSHSIEVFQKKSSLIKKEPISPQLPLDPSPANLVPLLPAAGPPAVVCSELPLPTPVPLTPALPPSVPEAFLRTDEPMGGLNLLCALAEQRFQEEGMFKKDSPTASSGSSGSSTSGSSSSSISSSSSNTSTSSPSSGSSAPSSPNEALEKSITSPHELSGGSSSPAGSPQTTVMTVTGANGTAELVVSRKRKHHKHSKDSTSGKKSGKKSKHDKEQRRAEKRRKHGADGSGTTTDGADGGELDAELKESLSRVKAKLKKCNCKDADEKDHRCCRTQWPTANELFSKIESDMKERLERITRQCEEKKRELEQMSTAAVAKVKPMANSSMVRMPEMGKTYFGSFGAVAAAGGMLGGGGGTGTGGGLLSSFGGVAGGAGMLGQGIGGATALGGGQKFSTIPALSPNFSSSSNSTTFVELPKLSSDTDSSGKREDDDACSMERLSYSKRKGGIPKKHDELTLTETIVAKKPKSLVGYILASKNTRVADSNVKDTAHQKQPEKQHHNHWSHVLHQQQAGPVTLGLAKQHPSQQQHPHHISESKFKKSPIHSSKFESATSDDTSNLSDSSLKAQMKMKSPAGGGVFAFEDENSKPSEAGFSIFGGKPSIFDKVKTGVAGGPQVGTLVGMKVSPVKAAVVTPLMKPHHLPACGTPPIAHGSVPPMKRKKSRSKDRKRRSSEKKRIDQRCLLTSEHLGKDKTRVLTAMGGLFYAGCLSAVQPPDIYAVTLDGERGNRPHIMSREEVLRDAILEVAPKTVDEIIPGTRLCAYWSQQYRCLYPGVAAEPASPDPEKRFVNVEFDDGDNGKIALEDIRFLMSDYPIVEYDPNPLLSLGKRKRQSSHSDPCAQIGTLGPASMGTHAASAASHSTTGSSHSAGSTGTSPSMAATATAITTPLTATVTPMISPLAGGSTINSFALATERAEKRLHDEAYREERRRLKKIRKDKLRRLAANNAELATVVASGPSVGSGGVGGGSSSSHKHKKSKSKCYDEFCKHRKHKKRRKHKKHHREAASPSEVPSSPDGAGIAGSMDDDISQGDSASQTAGHYSPQPAIISASDTANPTAEKEDTLTEEEVSSSVTESSGSYYQPQKKSSPGERKPSAEQNGSKIAAFLPARQLWAWCGKGYRRSAGRVKKQFYKSIQRGKETISVGDSAVFLSTGRPDRPYIGHIESMWETSTNNMVVRVKWFYHPEETQDCPNLKYPGALFQSPHEDENDVQTISHKCEVLALREYTAKFGADPKQYSSIYDNNDTYYLAGYYDPTVMTIKMQPEIEILPPNEKWIKSVPVVGGSKGSNSVVGGGPNGASA